jgi:hypothetical protein
MKILTAAGAKGGTGKTTTAVTLAFTPGSCLPRTQDNRHYLAFGGVPGAEQGSSESLKIICDLAGDNLQTQREP